MNTEVVICTMGTRGDILPFLSLAAEFRARGHSVTIMSNANWQALSLTTGAHFLSIAPEDPVQSGRDDYAFFVEHMLPAFTAMMNCVEGVVRSGRRQLLVYRTNMLGMECAAEKFAIPHVKVALQPSAIRSFDRPPWPLTRFAEGRMQHVFRRVVLPGLFLASDLAGRYRRHANAFRATHGLAPYGWGVTAPRTEDLTIVMAPDWFALPQRDWPANAHCVGFPYFAQATSPIDPETADILAGELPSIVFTPGTGVTDIADFLGLAERICEAVAMPGLFVSRAVRRSERRGRLICRPYVDLGTVLGNASLLVHHGGIGTTAQALRAGIPQLVFPDRFDQPDNAARVATLRLGGVVFDRTQVDGIIGLTRHLLQDGGIHENVRAAAEAISHQRAEVEAVDLIQALLDRES